MDESVLWAIAIGTGMLGLLLLTVASAAAAYWKFTSRDQEERATTGLFQTHGGNITSTEPKRAPANAHLSNAQPAVTSSPWLWVRAWIFAILHASTVSIVMGGVTFFEDLTKASAEIQSNGTVTFPKQLLPETISGSASRKRLSQSTDDSNNTEGGKPGQSGAAPSDPSEWEVVDLVDT